VLLAIAGWFIWLVGSCRQVRLGVAHLAILAAVTRLTIGALLGVLLQFQFASASAFLPAGAFVAHPTALVVGYLVIIGMAISEWKLRPVTGKLSRAGLVQISLPFVGGLILTVAALQSVMALFGLSILCEIAGIGIYLWRVGPRIDRTRPLARGSARHFAIRRDPVRLGQAGGKRPGTSSQD
jgi:hypothetical protein